ncbi:uncharacterized protein LOC125650185 isoform X2 [Ostrea edulis]|nr:uncharacterized protein LOC125650185 isoform X2 [Ostrea edulis]
MDTTTVSVATTTPSMTDEERWFGWFSAVFLFGFLCCCKSRHRESLKECCAGFFRHLLDCISEFFNVCKTEICKCFGALTSNCSFCKRSRLYVSDTTERTDAEAESSQHLVVMSVSGQFSELNEDQTENGDENPSVSAVPPPSYDSLVFNPIQPSTSYHAERDDENPLVSVIPPPSYEGLVSNHAEPSPSYHTESDDENSPVSMIPPPSYDSLVPNSSQPSPSHHTESDDENSPVSVIPPPSYEGLVSNHAEPSPSYHTESDDENSPVSMIPPPSYDSLVPNSSQPSPSY